MLLLLLYTYCCQCQCLCCRVIFYCFHHILLCYVLSNKKYACFVNKGCSKTRPKSSTHIHSSCLVYSSHTTRIDRIQTTRHVQNNNGNNNELTHVFRIHGMEWRYYVRSVVNCSKQLNLVRMVTFLLSLSLSRIGFCQFSFHAFLHSFAVIY